MPQSKLLWQSKLVLLLVLPFAAASLVLQTRWWSTQDAPVAIWTIGLSLLLALVVLKLRAATPAGAFTGAVIIAVHHPPFSGGSTHGGSPLMLADIDSACTAAGVWPHAVFSGHAHNYQRFTRTVNGLQIPYIVAGCGGHNPLSTMSATYRTPFQIDSTLTLESYDDTDYGYLRVIVNATKMTVEFHPQSDGGTTKTPDDTVTITLSTHTVA